MNRQHVLSIFLLLGVALGSWQNLSAKQSAMTSVPTGNSVQSDVRGVIPAALSHSIDSARLKEGQQVEATTTVALRSGSGILIPSDSKIIGHVTAATARSKGANQSTLGIVFDKIRLTGGRELPINGVIQAIAPNPKASAGPDTGAASSGTMAKDTGTNAATMPNPVWGPGPFAGDNPGEKKMGNLLKKDSSGVVGFKNMELENNSVLTSSNKEIKLDQGAQILIKAE